MSSLILNVGGGVCAAHETSILDFVRRIDTGERWKLQF